MDWSLVSFRPQRWITSAPRYKTSIFWYQVFVEILRWTYSVRLVDQFGYSSLGFVRCWTASIAGRQVDPVIRWAHSVAATDGCKSRGVTRSLLGQVRTSISPLRFQTAALPVRWAVGSPQRPNMPCFLLTFAGFNSSPPGNKPLPRSASRRRAVSRVRRSFTYHSLVIGDHKTCLIQRRRLTDPFLAPPLNTI
jgi:hypothetical protein